MEMCFCFCSVILGSALRAIWHSLSFKMISAEWMLPLTGPLLKGSLNHWTLVFSMYSLWINFDVSCLTLASLSWPDPAALLKGTVNRTFCLCVSCVWCTIPLFACLPVCKCFLLQLSDSLPSKRTSITGNRAVSVYNNLGLKQKSGFLWDSLWTTVQSVKKVERQRWREGEDGVAGESNKYRVERLSRWTN